MISKSGNSRVEGFTLIELMIVIAIISILAGVAIPSYNNSVRRGQRSDAHVGIEQAESQVRKAYTVSNSYSDIATFASPEGYYDIEVDAGDCATAGVGGTGPKVCSSFVITAVPSSDSPQKKDTDCLEMTMDSLGRKKPTECW
tara:strand:- start:575 stop:1003 length:429 start_codon:yes stop_codon:yes gene_type:complete